MVGGKDYGKKVIRNVRKNNIISLLVILLFGLWPNLGFFYTLFGDIDKDDFWIYLIICGALALLMDWLFIKTIKVVINPLSSDIFKKYGGPENIAKILEEIEETKEYEDKQIIISKNYVSDKKDYEKLIAFDDILAVHKLVHKTNFAIDGYSVIITDKYGHEIKYSYSGSKKDEEKVDYLLLLIGSKSNNAELGYTKGTQEHVKNNRVELPNISKSVYTCPDCGDEIEFGDKYCKNCSCKLNWEDEN